ncbi:extracellular solute-binding protein [Clostridium sp. C2-6-12]|uniref:extracellular solute-binding protein n=1 Tax=Clostridium sp. C2-6-12 TaxID=2698832 RepID=UPI00136BEDBC|nr:extracellular solute-binding protein [Clostridium sp. C2-6-12]
MKKSKFITIIILIVVMALSLFLVLVNKSEENDIKSTNSKIKKFTAFFAVEGREIPDSNRVKNVIAEKIGAKINETWISGQTAKERIGAMIASGEYPDFIDGGEGTQALVDAGALVPLEDKLDKYPNIKKFWSDSEWEKVKKDYGHIYYIPQFGNAKDDKYTATNFKGEAFWIQKAVLEWADYPKIATLDEYFDVIEKYKAANPTINGATTIGFEILCDDWRYFCLENPPQFLAGYPNDGKAIVNKETLTAKSYDLIPEAKKYFKKLNEEYNKGIIDPETFTESYDQYISKLAAGRVLGMVDQQWEFQNAEWSLKQQKMYERTYVPLALSFDKKVRTNYKTKLAVNPGSGLGITISCKDVDGALKVINDLLSNDVLILRNWGEKNIDYEIGSDGIFYRTEEQRANQTDSQWLNNNMCGYGYFPNYSEGYLEDGINCIMPSDQVSEFKVGLSEIDKKILKGYGFEKWADFIPDSEEVGAWYPIYSVCNTWTSDEPEGIALQKMSEIKKEWLPKVIMVKPNQFDYAWNQYKTTLTTQADIKAYEDALTEEVRRRVKLFGNH